MLRWVLKTSTRLLVGLLISVCTFSETLPFMPGIDNTQQNFLEGIVRGQFSAPFTPNAAAALGIEAGSRNYRVDATFGWNLTFAQRLKFTGEYLRQNIDYTFSSDSTRQWVQQGAFGVDYQYKLTPSGLNYVDVSGYYAYAPSIDLDSISGSYINNNNLIQYTALRRIAGSNAYGISPAVTLNPWRGGQATLAVNYDSVNYDTRYDSINEHTQGFGGTLVLSQQLGRNVQVNVSAGVRTPFNTYQADIRYQIPSSHLSLGLIGNYTQGKDNLPNTSLVGIEITYAFDQNRKTCDLPGNMNSSLTSWVQKPSVYMPQVLAVADQSLRVTTSPLNPLSDLPAFSGEIPTVTIGEGPVNLSVASYFTGSHLVFSATNLAQGLSINPNTGVISGQATISSNNVVVTATNGCGTAHSNTFSLLVPPPCNVPTFSGVIPSRFIFSSVHIDTAPYFTGNNLIFSATNLASGLSINSTTGAISGYAFFSSDDVVVTATNGCGSASSNAFSLM